MGKIFAICKGIKYWIPIWAIKTKNGAYLMTYELENYKSCIRNSWRTLNNVFALNKVSFLIIWALMFYLMVGFYSAKWQNFCHLQYEMAKFLPFAVWNGNQIAISSHEIHWIGISAVKSLVGLVKLFELYKKLPHWIKK